MSEARGQGGESGDPLLRIPSLALLPGFGHPRPAVRLSAARATPPRLLRAMGHFRVHPVTFGNRVTLYTQGRDAFSAMLEAVEGARDHVNLETYIFEADGVGRRFAEALARRAAAGVTVNLTVDAVGCWGTPEGFFEDLAARGVRVLVYNPVAPWRVKHGQWVLNRRNHRKILVVDGRVGFTGGMNIGDEYESSAGADDRWKDTHLKVEGPAVKFLQRVFMGCRWRKEGDAVVPADYFPALSPAGDHGVRVLPTNPVIGRPYVRIVLRRAIHAARESVHATQAYFMPDARVLWSLQGAARRGVDVGLVVPSQSDVPLALEAGRSTYGRLLRAGVAIHERLGPVLHQKSVVVDGAWSILGSANMDTRSFRINHEISLDVLGRGFGERLEEVYRSDLALS
ncbi:MAG: phospholipase D-like domain-containing protein, partial [Planctomycetes bacterium]|nr:phospholipase D-like domain-containing protein [Planctomycetota bacterium]